MEFEEFRESVRKYEKEQEEEPTDEGRVKRTDEELRAIYDAAKNFERDGKKKDVTNIIVPGCIMCKEFVWDDKELTFTCKSDPIAVESMLAEADWSGLTIH